MSYQVLARKWRPRSFKELVGQVHVLQALVNALDHNRLHHAYLFTGTRGVGKTTIARILAKCLNCETGVTSEPCGQCSACREIDEGRFVDLIEVDAASRTRLEDTKELLDNVQYAPTRGRFKVYLIDEVHMLSMHSFNALLKTLEEPPPHVKFLLATTDPHKLPVTILSRCLQFSLKNMSPEKVVEHLQNVLDHEGVKYEQPALWQLGRAADGSMRDALSLTDQAIAFCSESLTSQGVTSMLGTIDQDQVFKVLESLMSGQAGAVISAVQELAEYSPDYVAVLADMLSALHRIALAQVLPDAVDNSQGDQERILNLAGQVAAEDVQLFYQTGLIGRRDLPLAPDPRSGFEMVLLRMLAFRPDGVPAVPQKPLPDAGQSRNTPSSSSAAGGTTESRSEPEEPEPASPAAQQPPEPAGADLNEHAAVVSGPAPEASEQAVVVPDSYAGPQASHSRVVESGYVPAEPVYGDQYRDQPPVEMYDEVLQQSPQAFQAYAPVQEAPAVVEQAAADAPVADSPATEPTLATEADKAAESAVSGRTIEPVSLEQQVQLDALQASDWIAVSQQIAMGGVTGAIVAHCEMASVAGSHIALRLDSEHDTLYNDNHRQRIEAALTEYFGRAVQLAIEPGAIETETPAAWRERKRRERLAAARASFHGDEQVQAVVEAFSGTILDHTIEPVD